MYRFINLFVILIAIAVIATIVTRETFNVGLNPNDAKKTCYDVIKDKVSIENTNTTNMVDKYNFGKSRERVLTYGLKPGMLTLADMELGTMRVAETDGLCVLTPDLMKVYNVSDNCVLRDKQSGVSYNLPFANKMGVTPEGCIVDFRNNNWTGIVDTMYMNEHGEYVKTLNNAHTELAKNTKTVEEKEKIFQQVSNEKHKVEATVSTLQSTNNNIQQNIDNVNITIASHIDMLSGMFKYGRYVILESINNRALTPVSDIEVYDINGNKIRSVMRANMVVDLNEDQMISKIIVKSSRDSLINTRLSLKTSSGKTVFSHDITTVRNVYEFNMSSRMSNAIVIADTLRSSKMPLVDGVYNIICNNRECPTYCILNESYNGGGWMLMMKMNIGNTFEFNSPFWTDPTKEHNANDTNLDATRDAKYPVYNHVGIKDIMVIFLNIKEGGHLSSIEQTNEHAKGWVWICNNWYEGGKRVTGTTGFGQSRLGPVPDAYDFDKEGIDSRIWSAQYVGGRPMGRVVFGGHSVIQRNGRGWHTPNDFGTVRFGMVFNENGINDFQSNDVWCGIGGGVTQVFYSKKPNASFSAGDFFGCCGLPGKDTRFRALVFGR